MLHSARLQLSLQLSGMFDGTKLRGGRGCGAYYAQAARGPAAEDAAHTFLRTVAAQASTPAESSDTCVPSTNTQRGWPPATFVVAAPEAWGQAEEAWYV